MKDKYSDSDYELQTLLELNGFVFYTKKGYWIKFEAHTVKPTKNIPHGVKYSLTLHDKDNRRIVGYDNAHDCLPKRGRYRTKKNEQLRPKGRGIRPTFIPLGFASGIIRPSNFSALRF